jgi:hypothetical protein
MQVKTGDRICLDARAAAEAIEDLLYRDYYTRTPRIRLTGVDAPETAAEILLDGSDVATLVACAVRHPSLNMRQAVLTAIWNHPESFRDILRFGLDAPDAFSDIRKIVVEELDKSPLAAAKPVEGSGNTLLPKLPLPAHLRDRGRK